MTKSRRNRQSIWEAIKEIGCGLLTVMLFTVPVWVMTVSWRGPVFAVTSLLVLASVLAVVILLSRFLQRR